MQFAHAVIETRRHQAQTGGVHQHDDQHHGAADEQVGSGHEIPQLLEDPQLAQLGGRAFHRLQASLHLVAGLRSGLGQQRAVAAVTDVGVGKV